MDQRTGHTSAGVGSNPHGYPVDERMLRFRAAMDTSADAIYLVDRATMQFVDVNVTACKTMGYTREELLKLGPQDLLNTTREELEREYDAVIAAGEAGTITESQARTKEGRRSVTELHRRAMPWGVDWVIVTIARDVTRRHRAEKTARRVARMYAALSAAGEAILGSREPRELYQKLCDAALGAAPFMNGVTVYEINSAGRAEVVAVAGGHRELVRSAVVSVDESMAEGRGLIGTAVRTLKTCISNDFLNDERLLPWREQAREMGRLAAMAVPLTKDGRAIGVLHLAAGEVGAFEGEIVGLAERMARNVSAALEALEHEAERTRAEAQVQAAAQQFRGLVEQSIAGIYIVQERKFAYINQRYAEIFGYSRPDELIGREALTIVAAADRSRVRRLIHEQVERGAKTVSYTFTGIRKDGSTVEAGAHGARASHLGRPAIIGLLQDITDKVRAEEEIKRYVARLEQATQSTISVVATIGELRDPYTHGHERRVGEISAAIAVELGLSGSTVEGMRVAGYLHDVGKIAVPAEILAKPTHLTRVEFELVKAHAQQGYEILKTVQFPWPVATAALQHHERLNGSGYPQGLKEGAIIPEARILSVADVVEAMSSHRPYRAGLGLEAALTEIERSRGTLLDKDAVDACLRLFREKSYRLPQ